MWIIAKQLSSRPTFPSNKPSDEFQKEKNMHGQNTSNSLSSNYDENFNITSVESHRFATEFSHLARSHILTRTCIELVYPKVKRYVDFYNIILKRNHAKKECHFVKQCWCTYAKLFSTRTHTHSKMELFVFGLKKNSIHVLCVRSSICIRFTIILFFHQVH